MKRVTLGGDRLGSGKRQKVELKGYERSTQDLSYAMRTTMSAGTLVPFLCKVGLPGDTWDIDLQCDIKTLPTVGPLFGSYKVQLDIFQAPMRLYNAQLHNNKLGIGKDMSRVKFPVMTLKVDPTLTWDNANPDNAQVNPSCILSYLGIRGVGTNVGGDAGDGLLERDFQAQPLLMYWDTVKNFYANKQEDDAYVIHREMQALVETITSITIDGDVISSTGSGTVKEVVNYEPIVVAFTGSQPVLDQVIMYTSKGNMNFWDVILNPQVVGSTYTGNWDTGKTGAVTVFGWTYEDNSVLVDSEPKLYAFPLSDIDNMREFILSKALVPETPVNIRSMSYKPYDYLLKWNDVGVRSPYLNTQEGLAVKTYQSDLFNNWLNEEWIDGVEGVNAISSVAIDPATQSFTMDVLNLAQKVYMYLNRIVVSDGTYKSWLEVSYDEDAFLSVETPIYEGGLIKELVFQEVISNSETTNADDTKPIGTLAGRGVMNGKHKGGRVRVSVKEPCYIMGIVSITPRVDYSQGNEWDTGLRTMADLHVPALDEIGFQDLVQERMAWWTTDLVVGGSGMTVVQKMAGKQPAWIEYMTSVNKTFGDFAVQTNSMFMTLNRRYEASKGSGGIGLISDLTTYIDPTKFNYSFAQTNLNAMNFWCQIGVGIEARRKMSAKVMPNL